MYDVTMFNKDSFMKFIQFTPHHNSLKTRITSKLATAFRYIICKHSTFLCHKVS